MSLESVPTVKQKQTIKSIEFLVSFSGLGVKVCLCHEYKNYIYLTLPGGVQF